MSQSQPEELPLFRADVAPAQNIVKFPSAAAKPGVAEEIYRLYPFKVSRPQALRAIEKALRSFPAEFLKERTARYAELRKDSIREIPSVPYPATWFNGERFNDEESTWLPFDQVPTPARQAEIAAAKAPKMPSNDAPEGWEQFLKEWDGGTYADYRDTYRHSAPFMREDFATWRKKRK